MTWRVAAVQMLSAGDIEANLRAAEILIGRAVAEGATQVVLPETFALYGQSEQRREGEAESRDGGGPITRFLSEQSRHHGIWLVGGTLPAVAPRADGGDAAAAPRVFTRCLVFNPAGAEIAAYDKIHLFDVEVADGHGSYRESATFAPGKDVVVSPGSPSLGLSVCYDLRFPELYRQLRDAGADILCVPAAFTAVTGQAHWEILLRARAIETQCFVVGACQGGRHANGRETWPGTMIVDPWGQIVAQVDGPGEAVIVADLDPQQLAQCRQRMPLQAHRRLL